jgi:hypothetical protein
MVSMVQVWVSAEVPIQDFVVEGPIVPCSVVSSPMVRFEALPNFVEVGVYRGGGDGNAFK